MKKNLFYKFTYVQRLETCYNKIIEIDETLRQLGSTINYDRIYFIIIGVLIAWFIIGFSISIVVFIAMRTHTNVYKAIGAILTYAYGMHINIIIIFEFYIFVKYVN